MRNLSLFFIFAIFFVLSCGKDVGAGPASSSGVTPAATIQCTLSPQFTTTGQTIIQGYPAASTYNVNYSCSQNGVVVQFAQCQNASGLGFVSCPAQGSITLPTSLMTGNYNVQVEATNDLTQGYSSPFLYSFGIDVTPPYVQNNVIVSAQSTTSFTINFSAIDPTVPVPSSGLAAVQCALGTSSTLPVNPTWQDCSSMVYSQSGLTPGTNYWVFFWATDNAGNSSMSSVAGIQSYEVQTTNTVTPPNPGSPGLCTISYPANNAYVTGSNITITYSCPNPNLQNMCYLIRPGQGSGILQDCDETAYTTTIPTDGTYQFCVADGPTGATTCSSFNRDTAAPTVQITSLTSGTNSMVANFTGTDTGSGIARYTCALVNNENGKIYNGAQGLEPSITAALNDTAVPCGALAVTHGSISFDQTAISVLGSYTFYVQAYDNVGLASTPQDQSFVVGANNGLVCQITNPQNGAWTNNTDPTYNFSCSYNSMGDNMSFTCAALNVPRTTNESLSCTVSAPACTTTAGTTNCTWTGSFSASLAQSFYSSGDTIQVSVSGQDRSGLGAVLSSSTSKDTFQLDTVAPLIPQIDVYASTTEVLLTYVDSDPTPGSGLRSGVTYNVYQVDDDGTPNGTIISQLTDFDVSVSAGQLIFGPRNFYPMYDYRVDITAYDNVGNSKTESSLIFPGPNPNTAPSCSIQGIAGQSYAPATGTTSSVTLTCDNPFVASALETPHTTKAQCRVTAFNPGGTQVIGAWENCTGTNATLTNNSPFTWTLFNADYGAGNVKLEVMGCDSTFTYLCGSVSNFTYVHP